MIAIEQLLQKANELGASDIHITVGLPPKVRVRGEFRNLDYPNMMPEDTEKLVDSIMNDKQYKVFRENGEVDFSYTVAASGRYRVCAFKQNGYAACAMRVVSPDIPSLEQLQIPKSVGDLYKKKRGLILITGYSGSGKTTTAAAVIDKINSELGRHIVTLEKPVEYMHSHKKSIVNQREIGRDAGAYEAAVTSALREDADVIFIGELQNTETVYAAISAAEAGKLVISTMNTIGAANTVERIIGKFLPHEQQQIRERLAAVLEEVISQQLIARADNKGRIAAFEVMYGTPAVKTVIRESKTSQLSAVMRASKSSGMQTMDDAVIDLYTSGVIGYEDAVDCACDMEYVVSKLGKL